MRTLLLNGSPRPGGDTDALCAAFVRAAKGLTYTVRAYDEDVAPCLDCRACRRQSGCRVHDGMDKVYGLLSQADVLVIASPVFFCQLSGPLLSLLSRLQCRYMDRAYRGAQPGKTVGAALLAAGGAGSPEGALLGARAVFAALGIPFLGAAVARGTDRLPAARDEEALSQARELALRARERFS